jgi:hypothetical protein
MRGLACFLLILVSFRALIHVKVDETKEQVHIIFVFHLLWGVESFLQEDL